MCAGVPYLEQHDNEYHRMSVSTLIVALDCNITKLLDYPPTHYWGRGGESGEVCTCEYTLTWEFACTWTYVHGQTRRKKKNLGGWGEAMIVESVDRSVDRSIARSLNRSVARSLGRSVLA